MRLILAILLPWLQFFTIGRPFAGIICLILQITLIGWLPAGFGQCMHYRNTIQIRKSNKH